MPKMDENFNPKDRKMNDFVIVKRLFKYAKPYRFQYVLALVIAFVCVFLETLGPKFMGWLVDLLKDNSIVNIKLSTIFLLTAGYFTCLFVSALLSFFQQLLLAKMGQKMLYTVREEIFIHVESLSHQQLNNIPVGTLVTRVAFDTMSLNEMFTDVVVNIIKNIITLVVVLVWMFTISWRLALMIVAFTPIIVVASFVFRKFSRKAYRNVRTNVTNMNIFLSENISGIKITQAFNQEDKKTSEFEAKNNKLRIASHKEILVFAIFRPLIYAIYMSCVLTILYFGGKMAISGVITAGSLLTFYNYISQFFNPIQNLAEQYNTLQAGFASCEKIFTILDIVPTIVEPENGIILDDFKGKIEFKNVYFKYTDNQDWILNDVSFVVEPGQTCAFVGSTGSGKTTILSLIVRNYDIQKGQILIDDIDIKTINIASLRKNIGQMLQDVFLFSGTVYSNIVLKEESISKEDVDQACKYVNADHFINKLENGYLEEVKERGNNFSQGQRQLLSFARTIVHKPKLMILDEATANIDTETEVLIQDSLEKMRNIGTMLIVAHRLSTIQHADKIIVIHNGKIMEEGNHQSLLKKKGMYYNLYEIQFKKIREC